MRKYAPKGIAPANINQLNESGKNKEIMDFNDLESLVEQDFSSIPAQVLETKTAQYWDAIPEEILDLLEEAAETYSVVAPTLPNRLQNTAKKEMEFFLSLYKEKVKHSPTNHKPQPSQKVLQVLSRP